MAGINKVTLIGHLGADPDIKHLPDGTQIANLRIATSERWRDKTTGEPVERTEWHRVSLFGKLAEIAGQWLTKGAKVYLEGQLRTRKWQDQNGQDRYTTEVVLSGPRAVMQMLSSRADATTAPASATPYRQPKTQAQQAATAAAQAPDGPPDFDDDIPF
jgi:single-strand DNA-binding protein